MCNSVKKKKADNLEAKIVITSSTHHPPLIFRSYPFIGLSSSPHFYSSLEFKFKC